MLACYVYEPVTHLVNNTMLNVGLRKDTGNGFSKTC